MKEETRPYLSGGLLGLVCLRVEMCKLRNRTQAHATLRRPTPAPVAQSHMLSKVMAHSKQFQNFEHKFFRKKNVEHPASCCPHSSSQIDKESAQRQAWTLRSQSCTAQTKTVATCYGGTAFAFQKCRKQENLGPDISATSVVKCHQQVSLHFFFLDHKGAKSSPTVDAAFQCRGVDRSYPCCSHLSLSGINAASVDINSGHFTFFQVFC